MLGRQQLTTFLLVAISLLPAVARGQGGLNPTAEELAQLSAWKPEAEGAGIIPRVDLRPYLPPIGNQGRQLSCVGWATAYACKSYMVAQQRQWELGSNAPPERVFSPAYVYNQLNDGVDRGSNILRAQLLVEDGCATLKNMPYSDRDFRSQPSATAKSEARRFRSGKVQRIDSGPMIRTALRQGYVVPIVAALDPEFSSGRHPVFRKEQREIGERARNPGDPHGRHAMCVVGYDDIKQAFLLMNSWGTDWGEQGFIWVDYALMKTIGGDKDFLQTVLIVANGNDTFDPTQEELEAKGSVRVSGYADDQYVWTWRANLAAAPATLRRIARVSWSKPGQAEAVVSSNASTGFAGHGRTQGTGLLLLKGAVTYRNGKSQEVVLRLDRKTAVQRRLVLVSDDSYWGKKDGKDRWDWKVRLRGNQADLAAVKQVTYTAGTGKRVITASADNGFVVTGAGAIGPDITAVVAFHDGGTLRLASKFRLRDPVRENFTLTSVARVLGHDEQGRSHCYWSASLDGPIQKLQQIESVRYQFPVGTRRAFREATNAADAFATSGTSWGLIRLRAHITFKNGQTEELTQLLKPPEWGSP